MAGLSTVVHAGTRNSGLGCLTAGAWPACEESLWPEFERSELSGHGWFWLEWGDEVEAIRERERLEPQDLVEFENAIESGQYLDIVPDGRRATLCSDGIYYQVFKFSSKFCIYDILRRRAPFDKLPLQVCLEVVLDPGGFGGRSLVLYSLGDARSLIGGSSDISGFGLEAVDVRAFTHE